MNELDTQVNQKMKVVGLVAGMDSRLSFTTVRSGYVWRYAEWSGEG
jgi:hypothetical protein